MKLYTLGEIVEKGKQMLETEKGYSDNKTDVEIFQERKRSNMIKYKSMPIDMYFRK